MAHRWQIGILDLMIGTAMISATLAGTHRESPGVSSATVFCLVAIVGITVMSTFSLANLSRSLHRAVEARRLTALSGRIKWLMLDTSIVILAIMAIVIANFVLSQSETSGPAWLLGSGGVVLPIASIIYVRKWRNSRTAR